MAQRLTTPQSRLTLGTAVRVNRNHRDASGKTGRITVGSEKIGGHVYYTVLLSDSSIGRFTARELDLR